MSYCSAAFRGRVTEFSRGLFMNVLYHFVIRWIFSEPALSVQDEGCLAPPVMRERPGCPSVCLLNQTKRSGFKKRMNDTFSTHIKGPVHPENKHLHVSCSDFCLFSNVQEIDPALPTRIEEICSFSNLTTLSLGLFYLQWKGCWCSSEPQNKRVLGLILGWGPFCVGVAWSPHVHVGSLRVFRLPPTILRHVRGG